MFDEKAKNYKNNISVLEEKIAGHEVKVYCVCVICMCVDSQIGSREAAIGVAKEQPLVVVGEGAEGKRSH